jgi:hypothetical protein
MNRATFAFLATAIGITPAEYGRFFGTTAEAIAATETVSEECEHALLDWQDTHALHVEVALLGFRLWHRTDLLAELIEDFATTADLAEQHLVTQRARERYWPHYMDDLAKLTTRVEVVMPDAGYFAALAAEGQVTAPSLGMHISVFQHAILRARREGIHIEVLDSTGNP